MAANATGPFNSIQCQPFRRQTGRPLASTSRDSELDPANESSLCSRGRRTRSPSSWRIRQDGERKPARPKQDRAELKSKAHLCQWKPSSGRGEQSCARHFVTFNSPPSTRSAMEKYIYLSLGPVAPLGLPVISLEQRAEAGTH